jgi:signal transduction histidine kinase
VTRSLLARLTLLQQLITIVAVTAFALASLAITSQVWRSERRAFVASTAARLAGGFRQELADEPDTVVAARSVVDDGLEVGVQVEVRDATGRVVASSLAPAGDRDRGNDAGAAAAGERFVSTVTNDLGVRVTVAGGDAGRRAGLSALGRSLLLAAFPILVVSLLLGRVVVARALRPLSAMAERAASLSVERNPRSLGSHSGLAEVDRLAASFDRLLERLDDALRAERRLTADASHELRTPLTVLGGELDLLRERSTGETPSALGLERAVAQVAAMRELVEAILVLHRSREIGPSEAAGFEVLNLSDLAREALAEIRARHPGREPDTNFAAPDEVLVQGNAALLAAAVRNLLDNALKFTRAGDRVELSVGETPGQATLCVDDAGSGVGQHEAERIFDPFYRGSGARAGAGGFGLGLPILRRVARAHGGDVDVSPSTLGGARFAMRLPRYEAPARS